MTCARKTSWNKTLIPGPSNSSNMETAATLERRRETLIKKAKEYHKELESLLVSRLSQSFPSISIIYHSIYFLSPIYITKDRRTSTSIYNSQPTSRTKRKEPNQRTRNKRKTRKDQGIPGSTTCKYL